MFALNKAGIFLIMIKVVNKYIELILEVIKIWTKHDMEDIWFHLHTQLLNIDHIMIQHCDKYLMYMYMNVYKWIHEICT